MSKEYIQLIRDQRKAIYDLDCALWRARAEAERDSNYHTQLGHAIDALSRLQKVFGLATPPPDTQGVRAWYTIDELNEWADKYEAKQQEKPQ